MLISAHHCMDLRQLEEREGWKGSSSPYLSPSQPLRRVRRFGCWPLSLGIQTVNYRIIKRWTANNECIRIYSISILDDVNGPI